jgi:acetate kinase
MVLVLNKGASEEEMQLIREKLQKKLEKGAIDLKKYSGIIKLKEDPLTIQKKMRDEWH